ncbi:MAG TPA: YwiC-like family protein [Aggregatilinea sp.]|uniref:YwiC-like family protein n=1 Tax=Aggregatilinea sp. TaxID=2806333 RepID=UPI002CEF16F1|nr:YwiC-like family protein [Aggregatilinea sp.]HML22953.1 YwiC-like family protein [Aggregatilinea sp.]
MPSSVTTAAPSVRLKSIALPPEHGGWGFVIEPILLGLLVAPSWGGLAFGVAVLGVFLARHPLKIAVTDWRRGKRYARTVAAERVALGYLGAAGAGLIAALLLAGPAILVPVVLAVPLGIVQLGGTLAGRGRDLVPELAGAVALAAAAASIARAGGESLGLALGLWAVLAARDVPSILYVRERLHLDKGKAYRPALVLVVHVLAVVALVALAAADRGPWLAAPAAAILALRAAWGLSAYRKPVPVKTIGFLEVFYGLLVVVSAGLGYLLDL